MRRRRPGEGRGRGRGPNGYGAKRNGAAFTRSRDFVLKVRGMSRWNWRGVLEALEMAEEAEARFGEVRERERKLREAGRQQMVWQECKVKDSTGLCKGRLCV